MSRDINLAKRYAKENGGIRVSAASIERWCRHQGIRVSAETASDLAERFEVLLESLMGDGVKQMDSARRLTLRRQDVIRGER